MWCNFCGLTTAINLHSSDWLLNSYKSPASALNLWRKFFFFPRKFFHLSSESFLPAHASRNSMKKRRNWILESPAAVFPVGFPKLLSKPRDIVAFGYPRTPTHVCRISTHSAKLRIKHFNYTILQWRILKFPFLLHSPNSQRACFGAVLNCNWISYISMLTVTRRTCTGMQKTFVIFLQILDGKFWL